MILPVPAMTMRKSASVSPTYRCSFTSTLRTEVAVLTGPRHRWRLSVQRPLPLVPYGDAVPTRRAEHLLLLAEARDGDGVQAVLPVGQVLDPDGGRKMAGRVTEADGSVG